MGGGKRKRMAVGACDENQKKAGTATPFGKE